MDKIPVIVVNGFLESGKTTFIKEVTENDDKMRGSTIVIISTEEGEVEYEKEWLEKHHVFLVPILNQEEFTKDKIDAIHKKYRANLYVLELNAFYDNEGIEIPNYMNFVQQITLVDASSFKVMFNNMRKVFFGVFRFSDFVIFNRCDGVEELASFRRQVRAINQHAQIAFETNDGSLTTQLEEDLPYDLKQDNIYIEDDAYPIWYTEVYDKYEKYSHKIFKFRAYVSDIVDEKTFIVGRNVMVCCAEDIQMLAYEVINETNVKVKKGDAIYLECEVTFEYSVIDKEDTVILRAKKINKLKEDLTKVLGM